MGDIHYLKDMTAGEYYFKGDAVLMTHRLFERIGDYTRSQPTGPSVGRVYRKNLDWRPDTPDNWWLFICERDLDPRYILHRSFRLVTTRSPARREFLL